MNFKVLEERKNQFQCLFDYILSQDPELSRCTAEDSVLLDFLAISRFAVEEVGGRVSVPVSRSPSSVVEENGTAVEELRESLFSSLESCLLDLTRAALSSVRPPASIVESFDEVPTKKKNPAKSIEWRR